MKMLRGITAFILGVWAPIMVFAQDGLAGLNVGSVPPGLEAVMPDNPSGRLAHILDRGTLIVGVKDDYPPWGFVNEAGVVVGLEVDLAQALAARMGVRLEVQVVSSTNRISRVNDEAVDVVIATTGDTELRRKDADLLLPNYYSSGVVVYSRADQDLSTWAQMEGQPLCLSRGAYYNRTLEQEFGVVGQYFSGTRESRLALLQGRCVGWAFDDTALAQQIRANPDPGYKALDDIILVTPWAIVVKKGEGQGNLGRFVSDMIGEWHATGTIGALQDRWGIPNSAYIADKQAIGGRVDADGRAVCARDPATGAHPAECLQSDPFKARALPEAPDWMTRLRAATGIDLLVFADPYTTARLWQGLWLTVVLSLSAIAGALFVGVTLTLVHGWLIRWGWIGWVLLIPQRVLITVARMTPPILQLYIVFFGLGGSLTGVFSFTPSNLLIAVVILSMYAGATCTVILSLALDQERGLTPERSTLGLLPGAVVRGFDGLVAACVNIVKAAGMASAIAVSEVISTINLIVSEGGDTTTMMNGLLVFYFLFVLLILFFLKSARRVILGRRDMPRTGAGEGAP